LLRLVAKPGVLTALAFGLSGAAFVAANLLLARVLPVEQFALISLLVSIVNVAIVAAPLGIDGVVARNSVSMSQAVLRRVLLNSVGVAVVAAVYARLTYSMGAGAIELLVACVCAGAISTLVAAYFQAAHAFGRSLFYLRSPDYALFIASLVTLAVGARLALAPFAVMTAIFVVVAAAAWRDALRHSDPNVKRGALNFREAGVYLSVQLSLTLLMQLERLLAANLLTLRDLATLGVVLAVVGPPFRLLQLTAGYALQPRLRAAKSHSARIRLLVSEGIQATAMALVASVTLWFATPLVVRVVLHGKFTVTTDVLLAALISGTLKVYGGIAKASMTAIADNRELAYIGLISWVGVAVAIGGAAAGAHFGLSGVIYGVAAGWIVRVAATAYFVSRRLQKDRA
jgi:hypothetical protein